MLRPILIDFHDESEIERLHDAQERFTGLPVDRPNLLLPPIRVAVGFQDESGRLRGGYYIENVAEVCLIGNSKSATEATVQTAPAQLELLRRMGYGRVRCFIPHILTPALRPMIEEAGFHCVDEELSHFAVKLRRANVAR